MTPPKSTEEGFGLRVIRVLKNPSIPLWLLALVVAFSLSAGYAGIDYGPHWDEGYVTQQLAKSFRNGLFLPRRYNYPSVTYDIAVLGSLPFLAVEAVGRVQQEGIGAGAALQESLPVLESHAFLLYTRTVFLAGSLGLAVLWTFLLIRSRGRSRWEGLLGSALLASSWEIGYHARWIAPDAMLMQFSVLTMWLVSEAERRAPAEKLRWLAGAAMAAALACGSKYFGGIFLLPVLASAAAPQADRSWAERRRAMGLLLALFCVAFVLTTPGALVEPGSFLADIRREVEHYQTGHFGNTVAPGLEHGYLLLQYLALVSLSHYAPIAALLFGFAMAGVVVLLKGNDRPLMNGMLVVVPLIYVLYMLTQRVMIARNYLLVLPFLAVLSARGAAALFTSLPRGMPRAGLALLLTGVIALNAGWLAWSANSIVRARTLNSPDAVLSYLLQHPGTRFCLSNSLRQALPQATLPGNASDRSNSAHDCEYVLSTSDVPSTEANGDKWVANRPGRYRVLVGPQNMNFDYYPWWPGAAKIVSLDLRAAIAAGLVNAGFEK
jgi:hypothetical protein